MINFSWNNYELTQPGWLLLIPLFIAIHLLLLKFKNKYISKSTTASLADTSYNNQQLFHPLFGLLSLKEKILTEKSTPLFLYSIIFILFVIALTQPVRIGKKLPEPPQERDIVFIVDTSVSMILRDYILNGERIDRMSLLKGVLDKFITQLNGERMSIIVFGDHAYTLVPLTSDQYLLRKMLSRVQVTMAGRFNAIGEGIALAVKQAKERSNKRKRILVLFTDADQPTGNIEPEAAAALAKNENLALYTIAIGSTSFAAEESRRGGLLYSPVNLKLINQLSSITGAKSYQAGNPLALEKAIQSIKLHGSNKRKVKPLFFYESLYHWFLVSALILFISMQILNLLKSLSFKRKKVVMQADK